LGLSLSLARSLVAAVIPVIFPFLIFLVVCAQALAAVRRSLTGSDAAAASALARLEGAFAAVDGESTRQCPSCAFSCLKPVASFQERASVCVCVSRLHSCTTFLLAVFTLTHAYMRSCDTWRGFARANIGRFTGAPRSKAQRRRRERHLDV
jgi:hypothetical protein